MDARKRAELVKMVGEELALALIASADEATKELEARGIHYKASPPPSAGPEVKPFSFSKPPPARQPGEALVVFVDSDGTRHPIIFAAKEKHPLDADWMRKGQERWPGDHPLDPGRVRVRGHHWPGDHPLDRK